MGYAYSHIDRRNLQWFENDRSRNTLSGLRIENGNIRGIYPCEINYKYPISAFVGENGSGKSTILALAACAFHNVNDQFHQFGRKKSHFTFGDFFTFSPQETGLGGIRIVYNVRKQNGDILDIRRKKPSGKWNDFNTRNTRNVIYLGINRIVPPSESPAHCNYRRSFTLQPIPQDILLQVKEMASRIFGKNYSDLEIHTHNTYRLYLVRRNDLQYSGFNMGAGENAVISILLELLSAGNSALLVIDEIELGLHARAQKEFINVLKEICKENKCQIICSTHSEVILNTIPPEGRFFILNKGTYTDIIPGITSEYAFGKLAGQNTEELSIFVEDEVGKAFLSNILSQSIRERVIIRPIGSDQAVLRHIATYYREDEHKFIAFLDGDKRNLKLQQIQQIKNNLEDRVGNEDDYTRVIEKRLCYLPGQTWPERYIIESLLRIESKQELVIRWGSNQEDIDSYLEQALAAGKHKEFYSLAINLFSDEQAIRNDCLKFYKNNFSEECELIANQIIEILNE